MTTNNNRYFSLMAIAAFLIALFFSFVLASCNKKEDASFDRTMIEIENKRRVRTYYFDLWGKCRDTVTSNLHKAASTRIDAFGYQSIGELKKSSIARNESNRFYNHAQIKKCECDSLFQLSVQ